MSAIPQYIGTINDTISYLEYYHQYQPNIPEYWWNIPKYFEIVAKYRIEIMYPHFPQIVKRIVANIREY